VTLIAGAIASRLRGIGLTDEALESKAALFGRALNALGAGPRDASMWWVPGRIEFLGKHSDYAGGPSLVCAVERGFAVVAAPRADRRVCFRDACSGETVQRELDVDHASSRDHWSNYPLTVTRRIVHNFPGQLHGVDLAFASDLPPAAGLSSSSALIVASFLALSDANDLAARPEYHAAIHGVEELAGYLGAVENGSGYGGLAGDTGVGTLGGSQDHTAILCSRPGALVQYTYLPVCFERVVPLPNDFVFAVAASGVVAAKTGGALEQYNRASALAIAALEAWRDATGDCAPTLSAALAEAPNAIIDFREVLSGRRDLLERVEQFCEETRLVHEAGDALAAGDLDRLGALVDESQAAAERLLGNQIPETMSLARIARASGAVAASAFGAGFGGSVYALVRATEAHDFVRGWLEQYAQAFPNHAAGASVFLTRAGPPANTLA
jgi:galactokinase